MRVLRILNNNVVTAKGHDGQELIVMKLGLGFSKRVGDIIPKDTELKIFVLSTEAVNQYSQLINDLDPEALLIAEKIISFAEKEKNLDLMEMIHLSLADHLDGLFERMESNLMVPNHLTSEIKRVYQPEYEVGQFAKAIIEERKNYPLQADEAAFIALHFINNKKVSKQDQVEIETTIEFVNDMIEIVEASYRKRISEESLGYLRLVRHLQFFMDRTRTAARFPSDIVLYHSLKEVFPDAFLCVEQMAAVIKNKYQKQIQNEDKAYFIIDVERLSRD